MADTRFLLVTGKQRALALAERLLQASGVEVIWQKDVLPTAWDETIEPSHVALLIDASPSPSLRTQLIAMQRAPETHHTIVPVRSAGGNGNDELSNLGFVVASDGG